MRAELRADGLHISGYVNVPGRKSKPLITPHGRVIEIIEQRAFAKALERAPKIDMLLDHEHDKVLASTSSGTLEVREDAVGLHADSLITDPVVIQGAKEGRLKGWSFDLRNVQDTIEQRDDGLPIRHVIDFDMTEISLIMNKIPVYSSTSIEVRADTDEGEAIEYRAADGPLEFTEIRDQEPEPQEQKPDPEPTPAPAPKPNYHETYKNRIEALR